MFCIDKSGDVKGSLEVYNGNLTINDVCIAFQYGALKLHNIVIEAGEEVIWCRAGACEGGGRVYQIENCTVSGKDGTNMTTAANYRKQFWKILMQPMLQRAL